MLCIDTSSLIAYLEGDTGTDVDLVDHAFSDEVGVISPVAVTEVLSDPDLSRSVKEAILQLPVLPITEGFWERAGMLRARILRSGQKARLADTLIAQNCLDHGASLVTRDRDFRAFTRIAGLRIL
jgi:predicted nucleic acid-binding protein